ncbi:MAG TPA: fatty acid desaturase [Methylomirabilota bacterium]|nr:fatty acid desaturase [Methylomirabilota bacterium]
MLADTSSAKLKLGKAAWYQNTAKYGQPDLGKSLWQICDTLVPYLLLWAAMVYMVQQQFPYWLTLMVAVPAGGILVRIFILFHDCCHGSFFVSRRANTILGYITGILTFTPFEDWRRAHNAHHATAGDLDRRGVGDIWTMTIDEYLAAPLRKRFAYRFYRNPFILFGAGSVLFFLFLQRFSKKGAGKRERKSVLLTNIALLLIVGAATWTIGLQTYLLIQLPVILISGGLGLWLFYIQHQFENAYWVRHESWDPLKVALEGSSYFKLPKILQWFTGNIGLHHIHHVRPSIPNYNLQQCHDEIPPFQVVKAITVRTSLRSLQLGLYDERNKKLVSFGSLMAQ